MERSPRRIWVGSVEDVRRLGRVRARIDAREAVVAACGDGRLRAFAARCPHRGGPLGDGEIRGREVVCPLHRWRFDLESGRCRRDRSLRLSTFAVVEEDGRVGIEAGAQR